MIIEGGSQNASRIPGTFAYPAARYNPGGIEAISPIRGRKMPAASTAPAARLAAQERVSASIRRNDDVAALNLYQNPGAHRANSSGSHPTGGHLDLMA